MIKRKLDKIIVDVLEKEDGTREYQGAHFVYERQVYEDDKHVGNLEPEFEIVKPEDAVKILGETAGGHVAQLDRTENILATEREEWKTIEVRLQTEIQALNTQLTEANQELAKRDAMLSGAKKALGVVF